MASNDWRLEMENMLAAFNRQTIQSLSIIKLVFKRSSLSFTPEFKKYFMQASTISINEAYDRFQVNLMFEKQVSPGLSSVAIVSKRSPRNGANGVECETDDRGNGTSVGDESDWITNASDVVIQINDSGCDEVLIEAIETEPTDDKSAVADDALLNANQNEIETDTISYQNTSDTYDCNDGSEANDDLHVINEPIAHQLNTNERYIFDSETDESNDPIEKQGDSIDAFDNELIPVNLILDHLEESNEDWDNVARDVRSKKSAPKQFAPKNLNRCTICGYTGTKLKRHMRTHTGEKPYGCDRCGRRFKSAQSLMKHAATHIAEFSFHCRACFYGFSLKVEAVAHEKQCRKRHFECYRCKKCVTFDKTDLIKHMRKHSGDKPFRCEICMQRFGRKDNLKRHSNKIHA